MDLAICRHLKLGGGRCGSPAMRGQDYCYFHAGAHRTIPAVDLWPDPKARCLRQAHGRLSDATQQKIPSLDYELSGEATAIQRGFMRLIQGITQGLLNARQAKLMLAALQRAAANCRDNTATGDSAVTSNELTFTKRVVGRSHIRQNMP
ncbi:MAG: hypothetical protein ABR902_01455 [Candidatus Korobacteraceae bacterium]|jgi:hypothetical protein